MIYIDRHGFWTRPFGGRGISVRWDSPRARFSERYGYQRVWRPGSIAVEWLP